MIVISEFLKVRVKSFTPATQVLHENLSPRTGIEGYNYPALLSIDSDLLRPESLSF